MNVAAKILWEMLGGDGTITIETIEEKTNLSRDYNDLIILNDGTVIEPQIGHANTAALHFGVDLEKDLPIDASPLIWMSNKYDIIFINAYDFVIRPQTINSKQSKTLNTMVSMGILKNNCGRGKGRRS